MKERASLCENNVGTFYFVRRRSLAQDEMTMSSSISQKIVF